MKKLIIIGVLIVLGIAGFWFYQKGSLGSQNLRNEEKQEEVSNEPQNFTHPDLGFSFTYPPKYNLSIIPEVLGESILIQNEGEGMQLYITDFEGADFDSALVKAEITDVELENVMDINLPSDISAVSFSYIDASLGEVWNVWFVRGEKIYQLTLQSGHDEALKMFVETFKFN